MIVEELAVVAGQTSENPRPTRNKVGGSKSSRPVVLVDSTTVRATPAMNNKVKVVRPFGYTWVLRIPCSLLLPCSVPCTPYMVGQG